MKNSNRKKQPIKKKSHKSERLSAGNWVNKLECNSIVTGQVGRGVGSGKKALGSVAVQAFNELLQVANNSPISNEVVAAYRKHMVQIPKDILTYEDEHQKLLAIELLQRLNAYREQLAKDVRISTTKFHHMQTAIIGCKMIVRDVMGLPRIKEHEKLR